MKEILQIKSLGGLTYTIFNKHPDYYRTHIKIYQVFP
jgi:hypothetical protein